MHEKTANSGPGLARRPRRPKGMHSARLTDNVTGYLLIAPSLIGFVVFTLFGIGFSLVMSFTDWNLLKGFENAQFVGLKNFRDMFSDIYLGASLRNNALLLLVVPVTLFLAAILANAMTGPSMAGAAPERCTSALRHQYCGHRHRVAGAVPQDQGPVNLLLLLSGVSEEALPGWLSSSDWALLAVAIVLLWQNVGYSILMYSGALQSIPRDYYEAADLDGAGPVTKFFKITLPQLRPTTFMLTILGIINSLQMWAFVQVITNGGPGTATYTLGLIHLPVGVCHLPHGICLRPGMAAVRTRDDLHHIPLAHGKEQRR